MRLISCLICCVDWEKVGIAVGWSPCEHHLLLVCLLGRAEHILTWLACASYITAGEVLMELLVVPGGP